MAWYILTKLPTGSSPREGGGASPVRDLLLLAFSLFVLIFIYRSVVYFIDIEYCVGFGEFLCILWALYIKWRFDICLNTTELTSELIISICNRLNNNMGCQLENKVWYTIEFPPPFGSEGKSFGLINFVRVTWTTLYRDLNFAVKPTMQFRPHATSACSSDWTAQSTCMYAKL